MEGVGHPGGEALLKLGTTRVTFHDPGQLREPHHLAVRYVPDVGFADHRQQMMLAGRVEEDVPDVDHLVVVCLKADGQLLDGIHAQPGEQELPSKRSTKTPRRPDCRKESPGVCAFASPRGRYLSGQRSLGMTRSP